MTDSTGEEGFRSAAREKQCDPRDTERRKGMNPVKWGEFDFGGVRDHPVHVQLCPHTEWSVST